VITFSDESVLYFIKFVDAKQPEIYKYSYHYQDRNENMIFRYDMALHHKKLETFPHHKHLSADRVIKASAPALTTVLEEIDDLIEYIDF